MADIVPKLAVAWWRIWSLRRWTARFRSIMALDISTFGEMLRSAYAPARITELANKPSSFAMLAKHPGNPRHDGCWVASVEVRGDDSDA